MAMRIFHRKSPLVALWSLPRTRDCDIFPMLKQRGPVFRLEELTKSVSSKMDNKLKIREEAGTVRGQRMGSGDPLTQLLSPRLTHPTPLFGY